MDFLSDQMKKFTDSKPDFPNHNGPAKPEGVPIHKPEFSNHNGPANPEGVPSHKLDFPNHNGPANPEGVPSHKPDFSNHNEPAKPEGVPTHKPVSSAELVSSAKIVADAAKAAARNDTSSLDKAKVAGAAANFISAAGDYGKLDDKSGIGQYLDKAEKYLHQYETSHHHSSSSAGGSAPANAPPSGEAPVKKHDSDSGSGFGDYMKLAQGFMKK